MRSRLRCLRAVWPVQSLRSSLRAVQRMQPLRGRCCGQLGLRGSPPRRGGRPLWAVRSMRALRSVQSMRECLQPLRTVRSLQSLRAVRRSLQPMRAVQPV